MTPDMLHLKRDTWHVTTDTWNQISAKNIFPEWFGHKAIEPIVFLITNDTSAQTDLSK